jgi:adenylate kinase
VYHSQTKPLMAHYDGQGKMKSVHGVGTIDEIFNRLCEKVDK